MNISELPIDARALLYFHIRSTEHYLTGKINEDQSIPYVKFRERTLTQLAIGGADVMQMQVINRFGGMCRLFDASCCLTAIHKELLCGIYYGNSWMNWNLICISIAIRHTITNGTWLIRLSKISYLDNNNSSPNGTNNSKGSI